MGEGVHLHGSRVETQVDQGEVGEVPFDVGELHGFEFIDFVLHNIVRARRFRLRVVGVDLHGHDRIAVVRIAVGRLLKLSLPLNAFIARCDGLLHGMLDKHTQQPEHVRSSAVFTALLV